jgi:hypothetical protein
LIKFPPRHLSQARTWISNVICRGLLIFYIQWTKVRGDCSLCWYCWNCLPSLLKLSFHNYNVKPFFYEGAHLFFRVCKKPHSHSAKKFSETDIIKIKFLIDNTFAMLDDPCVFSTHRQKLSRSFNFTFRYIDDILSLSYSKFDDNIDHIYQIEF